MGFDDILKQGEQFIKDGKVNAEDLKDAYANYNQGGDLKTVAMKTYADYKDNHKNDDKKKEHKKEDKD